MNMDEKTKILVVDDEEIVRLSHTRTLASVHCNVEVVPDGNEALRLMEQRPADVVLLDLRMPGMDGMAVLKTIKQRWPETEVVIITGYPTIETAKEAVSMVGYPVMITTSVSGHLCLMVLRTAMPSIPGMRRSSNTTSAGRCSISRSASFPSGTTSTLQ